MNKSSITRQVTITDESNGLCSCDFCDVKQYHIVELPVPVRTSPCYLAICLTCLAILHEHATQITGVVA